MAEEGPFTTGQQAQYDERLDASFRLLVEQGRSGEAATSSMVVSAPSHGIDERISIEDSSTVTPSNWSRQRPQSHGHGTDETRTAEHASTMTDVTDEPALSDTDEDDRNQIGILPPSPPSVEMILLHINEPPTPRQFVQEVFEFADQSDVPVSEEELLCFERQPPEVQKKYVKVFLKEFVYMRLSNDIAGLEESFA